MSSQQPRIPSTRHPLDVAASGDRSEPLRFAASLGAITAEALAIRQQVPVASARARLSASCRRGLLERRKVLHEHPALYALTAAGARQVGIGADKRCKVRASNAHHLIACAMAAAALERCYPGHRALGEAELRAIEGSGGRPVASARMTGVHAPPCGLHRPDLLLVPDEPAQLPIAVEVELTVKSRARLRDICLAWARCAHVAGVLYLVAEQAEPALRRAVAAAQAHDRIAVVGLRSLPGAER